MLPRNPLPVCLTKKHPNLMVRGQLIVTLHSNWLELLLVMEKCSKHFILCKNLELVLVVFLYPYGGELVEATSRSCRGCVNKMFKLHQSIPNPWQEMCLIIQKVGFFGGDAKKGGRK